MNAGEHFRRRRLERLVDQPHAGLRVDVRILAPHPQRLALVRVAHVGEVGVVELQVAAAGGGQVVDLVLVDFLEVGMPLGEVGIGGAIDLIATAAQGHRRGGDGHLADALAGQGAGDDGVVAQHDRGVALDLGGDPQPGRAELEHFAVGLMEMRGVGVEVGFHPFDAGQEVEVEIGAAELAVRGEAEAELLLQGDHVADGRVFDPAQLLVGDFPCGRLGPGGGERRWTQQAAHMVGAEWPFCGRGMDIAGQIEVSVWAVGEHCCHLQRLGTLKPRGGYDESPCGFVRASGC